MNINEYGFFNIRKRHFTWSNVVYMSNSGSMFNTLGVILDYSKDCLRWMGTQLLRTAPEADNHWF